MVIKEEKSLGLKKETLRNLQNSKKKGKPTTFNCCPTVGPNCQSAI